MKSTILDNFGGISTRSCIFFDLKSREFGTMNFRSKNLLVDQSILAASQHSNERFLTFFMKTVGYVT